MAVEIIYETHQTSTDNEAGIATGWLPGKLSALGRAQALELGERRRHDGLAAVFTSDLHRAVETAEIAFGTADIPIIQDGRLRECNYGELNGAPVARVAAERPSRVTTPFPGGQSYEDVVRATEALLRDLVTQWNDSCEAIYHTGDAVGIGPFSAEVLDRLLHTPGTHEFVRHAFFP